MRQAFFVLFVFSFLSMPVMAQNKTETPSFISGAYLMNICQRNEDGKETVKGAFITCQSYIAGIIDYHKLLKSLRTAPSIDFCVSNTTKLNDLQDIVWAYLNKNTQHDDFNAAPAVTLALNQVFPCLN